MSDRLWFWLKCFILSAVTLFSTFLIDKLLQLQFFKLLFPETVALSDFEYTDFAFLLRPKPKLDTNIVLVNVSTLGRAGIAKQIEAVNKFNPAVIGLDILFSSPTGPFDKDSLANLKLKTALNSVNSVVLAKSLLQTDSVSNMIGAGMIFYDSAEVANTLIRGNSSEAYANLYSLEYGDYFLGGSSIKIARSFMPSYKLKTEMNYAFGVKIAQLFDSSRTSRFLNRKNQVEQINFRGGIGNLIGFEGDKRYRAIDFDQVTDSIAMDSLGKYLNGKIVLFGFMGIDLTDSRFGDMYFTPLNSVPLGKSLPDMYGAVVHANIISMILNHDYIDVWPKWVEYLFAFLICFLHVAILLWLLAKFSKWFDWLALLIIFGQLVLIASLRFYLFYYYNLKVELAIALASMAVAGFVVNQANHLFKKDLPLNIKSSDT